MRLLLFRIQYQPGVAYESVAYKKKNVIMFCSLLKIKKGVSPMSLSLCLPHISFGSYCQKNVAKGVGMTI